MNRKNSNRLLMLNWINSRVIWKLQLNKMNKRDRKNQLKLIKNRKIQKSLQQQQKNPKERIKRKM